MMGGVGYTHTRVPYGVAQGTGGACVKAMSAIATARKYRARGCGNLHIEQQLPRMHHTAKGWVNQLPVAPDEAQARLYTPPTFQHGRGIAKDMPVVG